MTDNIQKLYEITEVEKKRFCEWTCQNSSVCDANCKHFMETRVYFPPFTAEKQLQLIKTLSNNAFFCNFHCYIVSARRSADYGKWVVGVGGCDVCHEQFEQALAGLVLEMWDGIPTNQKQEIKEILK